MRDIYEVLREKEMQREQLRREIENLRIVAPLLHEETDSSPTVPSEAVESIVWKDPKTGRPVKPPWQKNE
jgi:hypothetical protein